ncbi:Protein PHOX1 [Linum grandiflorum]
MLVIAMRKQQQNGKVSSPKTTSSSPNPAMDKDEEVFISKSQELKDEGNKLFQKRDHNGALAKYEKAIKLLPKTHIDVSHLRSNMAACYMQMGLSQYPRAIHECNLALEVTPKYGKALLKRARCYEALNRLDLALRDVGTVLKMEPANVMAFEVWERVKKSLEEKGLTVNDTSIELPPDYAEPSFPSTPTKPKTPKDRTPKKKNRTEDKDSNENKGQEIGPKRNMKLVMGDDIRCAQVPVNCSLLELKEVVCDRFPGSRPVLIKYKDAEGDLITITTDEDLRLAEACASPQGSFRLYLIEINPQQDPIVQRLAQQGRMKRVDTRTWNMERDKEMKKGMRYVDEWIVEFAKLFKDHVALDTDTYLGLNDLGIKLYSEAIEETVTSDEAQGLFNTAAENFQEMAALALFNWGNVHMSRARKKIEFKDDTSRELILEQINSGFEWTRKEYLEAGQRYEEALQIKPDFYEGLLALGQQQFERARLTWYYALSSKVDLSTWSSAEVIQLYNSAQQNVDRGLEMWEASQSQRITDLSDRTKIKSIPQGTVLDELFKDTSPEDASKQVKDLKSQMNLLRGTILYERSMMEYRLGIPVWQECLEFALDKFQLAGASPTDIAVMMKNHISNDSSMDGLGFKIDEIVEAWNDMNEATKWQSRVHSFRLEPLLRRRVSKIYHALEVT